MAWKRENRERARELARANHFRNRTVRNRKRRAQRNKLSKAERDASSTHKERLRLLRREEKIANFLATNIVPNCECGCGEPVAFGRDGEPNRYILGHTPFDPVKAADAKFGAGERVDIQVVREALRKAKEKQGLTWSQVAEKAGLSGPVLNQLLYDKRAYTKYGPDKQYVENMFRRLLGFSAPPSEHMIRVHTQERKRHILLPGGEIYQPFGSLPGYDPKKRRQKYLENGT